MNNQFTLTRPVYIELTPQDYKWWDKRVRQDTPLTEEEKTVVDNCGGLYYLYNKGRRNGFKSITTLEVHESEHCKCHSQSICKTGSS